MIPLAVNPKVLILTDDNGNVIATATNVAPDLEVTVVKDKAEFEEKANGMTFTNVFAY